MGKLPTKEPADLTEIYGEGLKESQKKECLCEVQANLSPAEETEVLTEVMARMTDLQSSINNITEMARGKIAKKMRYLSYLETFWKPFFISYLARNLARDTEGNLKRKSMTFLEGCLCARKTGGWKLEDREATLTYLTDLVRAQSDLSLSTVDSLDSPWDKDLPGLPAYAKWKIDIDRRLLFQHCESTGEVVPGVGWEEENELGKIQVGTKKPWSTTSLVSKIRDAFGNGGQEDEEP